MIVPDDTVTSTPMTVAVVGTYAIFSVSLTMLNKIALVGFPCVSFLSLQMSGHKHGIGRRQAHVAHVLPHAIDISSKSTENHIELLHAEIAVISQ